MCTHTGVYWKVPWCQKVYSMHHVVGCIKESRGERERETKCGHWHARNWYNFGHFRSTCWACNVYRAQSETKHYHLKTTQLCHKDHHTHTLIPQRPKTCQCSYNLMISEGRLYGHTVTTVGALDCIPTFGVLWLAGIMISLWHQKIITPNLIIIYTYT